MSYKTLRGVRGALWAHACSVPARVNALRSSREARLWRVDRPGGRSHSLCVTADCGGFVFVYFEDRV
jgi:hypothetical protein